MIRFLSLLILADRLASIRGIRFNLFAESGRFGKEKDVSEFNNFTLTEAFFSQVNSIFS